MILAVLTSCAALVWATTTVRLPDKEIASARIRHAVPMPTDAWAAVFVATVKRYSRIRELRRQALLVVVSTTAGTFVLSEVSAAPFAYVLGFATAATTFGASVFPLATAGLEMPARWLWHSAPLSDARIGLAHVAAALACTFGVTVVAVAPALAVAWSGTAGVTHLLLTTALLSSAALVAGSYVPWTQERLLDQLRLLRRAIRRHGRRRGRGAGDLALDRRAAGGPARRRHRPPRTRVDGRDRSVGDARGTSGAGVVIRLTDRVEMPAGVTVTGAGVHDDVRDVTSPVNGVGHFILGLARAGENLDAISAALVARYGITPERARSDVLRFCTELNARRLLNVRIHGASPRA